MDNDILVVRVNMFLKNKEQEAVRQCILEQRKTGIIVLPPYCEAIVVPKGVSLEVYFNQYCSTCKNKDLPESKDPCHECLNNPSNEDSHRPVNWEDK